MFGAVREFQAPLGVTHGVRGRFGPTSNSYATVFARKNSLDIYVIRANKDSARLELLQHTPLGANVMSMAPFRRPNSSSDLLCVGFENMRLVVLFWDHDSQNWITEQLLDMGTILGTGLCVPPSLLHVKDDENLVKPLVRGSFGEDSQPLIRSDPTGRCLSVLARGHHIIYIIPLHGDDDPSKEKNTINTSEIFTIDLPSEYEISNVKDYVFLYGSFEPNIVLLCEPKRTWAGRAAIQSNTCVLLSISVDLKSKKTSKTWIMDQLPYDCEKLEAIPESAGNGVLIISARVIMQMRHGACVAGLSLNCYGDEYAENIKNKYDNIIPSDTLVECDAAHCRFLDVEEYQNDSATNGIQNTALLSLKGGELYFLTVAGDSRTSIQIKRAGSTVIASEIVPVNERFFILTSRLSDSLLIEYQRSASEKPNENQSDKKNGKAKTKEKIESKTRVGKRKRMRTPEEIAEYEMIYGTKPPDDSDEDNSENDDDDPLGLEKKEEGTRGVYDDEDELGFVFNSGRDEDQGSGAGTASDTWALKVKDTLSSFGPGTDVTIGSSPDDITRSKLDMVIAGGYAKNGCLAILHQTIRPIVRKEFEAQSCTGVWALSDLEITRNESAKRKQSVAAKNSEKRDRNESKLLAREKFIEEEIARLKQERLELQLENDKKNAENRKDTEISQTERQQSDSSKDGTQSDEPDTTKDPKHDDGKTATENKETSSNDDGPPPTKKSRVENQENDALASMDKDIQIDEETMRSIQRQAESVYPLEKEGDVENFSDQNSLHAYMLLSFKSSTIALRTGDEEITELPSNSTDFITSEETICAGNVFGASAIAQIVPSKVRILHKGKTVSEWNLQGVDSYISFAQISDPLILLQTNENKVFILSLKAEEFDEEDEHTDIQDAQIEAIYDDYGMSTSPHKKASSNDKEKASAMENGDKNNQPNSADKRKRSKSYRNFSIQVDVSPDSNFIQLTSIAASYIYKGHLATEIAKDGILSDAAQEAPEVKDPVNQNLSGIVVQNQPEEAISDKNKPGEDNDHTDDEDRMLYGDRDDDDEDKLLYGTDEQDQPEGMDEDTKDIANGAKSHENDISKVQTGSINDGTESQKQTTKKTTEKGVFDLPSNNQKSALDDHLIVLMKKNGTLVILSKTLDYKTILECPTFFAGPSCFKDLTNAKSTQGSLPRIPATFDIEQIALVEVSGSALLSGLSTPVLIAIPRMGVPLIYRGFLASKTSSLSQRSRLRFRRIIFKDRTTHLVARMMNHALQQNENFSPQKMDGSELRTRKPLTHFTNIAGRAGLFVGGSCPFFVFTERGYPRVHSLSFTHTSNKAVSQEEYDRGQGIVAFTEFHNVMCPRGFVYVGSDGNARIGELPPPSVMNYDAPTPMRKIALRCTPHKVAYHARSETYGVLASMPTLTTREERLARILQSLEKHDKRHYQHTAAQAEAETVDDKANRVPPLFEELHELRVYRPDTWDLVKSHKLQKGEVGLAISNMTVDVYKPRTSTSGNIPSSKKGDDGNESPFAASIKLRPKNLLVVGTGHLNGEDASSRGRLLLFEISRQEVYAENRAGYAAFQLQLIAEKELFAPVTAVASMEGYVIAAVGPQVNVYKLVEDEIVHLSFSFGQLYCTSMASLKQYIVTADMWKSVSFMYYRDRNNSVNFLGKDYEYVKSYATEFLIEGDNMSIILTDDGGNFQMLNYVHASVPESRGGKRLLTNGGFNFGSRVNSLARLRTPDRKMANGENDLAEGAGRQALVFSTLDGGTGAFLAIQEEEFEVLQKLRTLLERYAGVARIGGINIEEENAFRRETKSSILLDQRLLDTRMVEELFTLTLPEMDMIIRDVGTELKNVVRTLLSVDAVLSRF